MLSIALAADHQKMREIISKLIQYENHYEVSIITSNGFQLIEKLNSLKCLPSIAIVDVQMPVMDGVAATNFISEHFPSVKVLGISLYNQPTHALDVFFAGAKGFLTKNNLAPRMLSECLETIINGELFVDESLGDKDFYIDAIAKNKLNKYCMHAEISSRERMFLQLASTGASYDEIATIMHIGRESVANYQKSLKDKTGIGTRQELAIYSIQHGIAKIARFYPS